MATNRRPMAPVGAPAKKPKRLPSATVRDFTELGSEIMNRTPWCGSHAKFDRRWVAHFGGEPPVCADIWVRLRLDDPDPDDEPHPDERYAKPVHLLWALLFLKSYREEDELASKCGGVDEGTLRKWVVFMVDRVSYLEFDVIVWSNRFVGDKGYDSLVTVDGTDCPTNMQKKSPKAFYSFKFKKSGLRYEVCICILTGEIVWISGPFPCGDWPDLEIFRHTLKHCLGENERVEADDGYGGEDPDYVKSTKGIRYMEPKVLASARSRARNRQETANDRLKLFKVLTERFRHDIMFHSSCFRACAVVTQLSFAYGKGLFSVEDAVNIANASENQDVPLPSHV